MHIWGTQSQRQNYLRDVIPNAIAYYKEIIQNNSTYNNSNYKISRLNRRVA